MPKKKRKPESEWWITKAEAAAVVNMHKRNFDKYIRPLIPESAIRRPSHLVLEFLVSAVHEAGMAYEESKRPAVNRDGESVVTLAAGDSPAAERGRLARAKISELDLKEREGSLVPKEEIREWLGRFAARFRLASDDIAKRWPDAAKVLTEALDEIERDIDAEGE